MDAPESLFSSARLPRFVPLDCSRNGGCGHFRHVLRLERDKAAEHKSSTLKRDFRHCDGYRTTRRPASLSRRQFQSAQYVRRPQCPHASGGHLSARRRSFLAQSPHRCNEIPRCSHCLYNLATLDARRYSVVTAARTQIGAAVTTFAPPEHKHGLLRTDGPRRGLLPS